MKDEKWVVRFLNLPSQDQIEFLYRFCLEESIKDAIEKKVYDSETEQP